MLPVWSVRCIGLGVGKRHGLDKHLYSACSAQCRHCRRGATFGLIERHPGKQAMGLATQLTVMRWTASFYATTARVAMPICFITGTSGLKVGSRRPSASKRRAFWTKLSSSSTCTSAGLQAESACASSAAQPARTTRQRPPSDKLGVKRRRQVAPQARPGEGADAETQPEADGDAQLVHPVDAYDVVCFIALREIAPGEELSYGYHRAVESAVCRCGAASCRGRY